MTHTLRLVAIASLAAAIASACATAPKPDPYRPPGPPPVEISHLPVCVPPGLVTGCWHHPPGQDWVYNPPAPVPPADSVCPNGRIVARFHPYLQGIDITWVCKGDQAFCDTVGQGYWWTDGTPRPRYDCSLGPDLSEVRNRREKAYGCPAVYWSHTPDENSMVRCTSTPNPTGMSCDHWSMHNAPPYPCATDTGYFVIPQGKGFLQVRSLVDDRIRSDIQYYEQK